MNRRERLARSVHVFLVGILIACGVEVAVDWHSTLGDVRVLRARVRQRGESYAAVLVHPLAPAVARRDTGEVERLVSGVFDDPDVVFARVTGPDDATLYERIDPAYAGAFSASHGASFDAYYAHQLARDSKGIAHDAEGLRARMTASRHRDVAQAYQDLLVKLHVAQPDEARLRGDAVVLFQDRLYTPDKRSHDDAVTYALGKIEGGGAFVVAFDMRPTNDAIRAKYLKGAGMILFFVMLIVLQHFGSRREKLRLLDLESKYARAKESIRAALPAPIETAALRVAGALAQSVGTVDGMLFDAFAAEDGVEIVVVDPEGEGVEAAAVALHVRATYRHRREDGVRVSPREELAALGSAALRIPGERPIAALLVRVRADGAIEGLACGMDAPRVVAGEAVRALDAAEGAGGIEGVSGPARSLAGALAPGDALVIGARRVDGDAIAAFVARSRGAELAGRASDAATWARGKSAELASADDVLVVVAERAA